MGYLYVNRLTLAEAKYGFLGLDEPATLRHCISLRRSHLEIRMDILSCVKAGAEKPTQIMYKANLSWNALKEHLEALEQGGLLNLATYGRRKRYELTDKAIAVLMAYSKVIDEVNATAPAASAKF
jgi:predicted transcriptional regulator